MNGFFAGLILLAAIPVTVLIALVAAARAANRSKESLAKIDKLQWEIASLRMELARLGEDVAKITATGASSTVDERSVSREARVATAPAEAAAAPIPPRPAASAGAAASHSTVAAPAAKAAAAAPVRRATEPNGSNEVTATTRAPAAPAAAPSAAPTSPAHHAPPAQAAREPAAPHARLAQALKNSLPLEQLLGMNLFARIGIALLVLGFALLGRIALTSMGPAARVALSYAAAGGLLGSGIWLELREQYRVLGRALIGGGWALLFFTTYALYHVAPMSVLRSLTVDCVLMLLVAGGMVAHTLRYRSQVVTGLAFLLGFSTVALSQDGVYALAAGVILAFAIAAIALRMSWFELEVFGVLASYANHFYWLYKIHPNGFFGQSFPQFWASAMILGLYWAIFRASYVARKVQSPYEERVSTLAALANSVLLLAVMRFQATRHDLAFTALLALGALEFALGQLPVTRRRYAAFALLTVIGTLLLFAAVPFSFSGDSIALLWMIGAEALLMAGLLQREALFRLLGLAGGLTTGVLVVYEARNLLWLPFSADLLQPTSGTLLLACSVLFYLNALVLFRRSPPGARAIEPKLAPKLAPKLSIGHCYLGAVTAFLGTRALLSADWTSLGWAGLLLLMALLVRLLRTPHLLVQAWAFAIAVVIRAAAVNAHLDLTYRQHSSARLITLPALAVSFYLTAWLLKPAQDLPLSLRTVALWSGSAALAALAWLDLPQAWVAPAWAAMAIVLCCAARRLRLSPLNYQEHVLAAAATAQLLAVNLPAATALERYVPLIACAGVWYILSRFCTQSAAAYRRAAAWLHTWIATALLAALAWQSAPDPWVAVLWVLFALLLTAADRLRKVEELPWQVHTLAALAAARAVTVNVYLIGTWHGVDLRLLCLLPVAAGLYALGAWVRLPEAYGKSELRQLYSWAATGIGAWLLWSELQPITVAPGLGVFGLILLEIGLWRAQRQLALQAYVLLAASFGRIFFVNLTAVRLTGELLSPALYTVAPLVLIYFYVWQRLNAGEAQPAPGRWPIRSLMAYFGSGSIAALLYYQTPEPWIIAAWAVLAVMLLMAGLAVSAEVFLEQTALLTAGLLVHALAHNIFGDSYFGGTAGTLAVPGVTAAVLLAGLPVSFRARARYADRPRDALLTRTITRHPEQVLFFAALALITITIAVKMNPGRITLAWGIAGLGAILLGLCATERSYRITGLLLLLVCVGKIVVRDAWHLSEGDRYMTFIALGGALTLVSALYSKYHSKYRDHLSRWL